MGKLTYAQTTFASGELDPAMRGQHNLKAYSEGAKQVRDCVRRASGGVRRRAGFDDLSTARSGRLQEFEFSDEQRYVFNFCNAMLEVFDLNGTFLCEIGAAPWTDATADELTFTQNGDVMVVTNCSPTKLIKRTGATTFTMEDFAFDISPDGNRSYQPFFKFALPAVTLTPSAATGTITLTTSAAHWTADYVGKRIRVYDAEVLITGYTSSTVVTGDVKGTLVGKLDIDPFKSEKNSTVVEVTHVYHGLATGASISFTGSNDVDFIPSTKFNTAFTITVIDEHHYSINLSPLSYTVREDANFDGVNENTSWTTARNSADGGGPNVKFSVAGTPTRTWLEPSISSVRGYPAASAFHEGRLWLGGTPSQPDYFWSSWTFQPYNFDVGTGLDAQSIQGALGSEDVSRIRHIISNGDLQMFTSVKEYVLTGLQGGALTPGTTRAKSQSSAGTGLVQPVPFDGATLFVQENGLGVSEFVYSDREAAYLAVPVSSLAGHLIRNPRANAVSSGSITQAEQFAFFVNADGTVAVFHSLRAENIAGWGLWTIGAGTVRSICAVGQYVYLNVAVRGVNRLYRMAEGGIYCLDGQVRHAAGAPTRDWVVSVTLRGRTDQALVSELGFMGLVDIPLDGRLRLENEVSTLVVGDPFYFVIQLLAPVVAVPSGSRMGTKQRVVRTIVDVLEAFSLKIGAKRFRTLNASDPSGAISALSGIQEARHLGYTRSPGTIITQDEPLPVDGILSVLEEVNI